MKSKHLSSAQGFSLVELLVVVAVIAIIAAIAIPNIANITSSATSAKDQRNAQNIASVASAARAAGATNNWTTTAAVVASLTNGITTNGLSFGISTLSQSEISGADKYLDYSGTNGLPSYSTTPKATQ